MSEIKKSETRRVQLEKTGEITQLEQQNTFVSPLPNYQEMAGYESVQQGL